MDWGLLYSNVFNPPILFFFLGMAAVWLRSDLEIPAPVPRVLSYYLLFAIGLHGGTELRKSGPSMEVVTTLGASVFMACLVPVAVFFILKKKLGTANATGVAATYGSISAVTFITATSFLTALSEPYGGHMVAAMALMESPAIIVGVLLFKVSEKSGAASERTPWSEILHDAFLNSAVFILMGSLLIGIVSDPVALKSVAPFAKDIFKGVLAFFLLDMGIVAARRAGQAFRLGWTPLVFSVLCPLASATVAVGIAWALGMGLGNALLFVVLCASASYIAVPAAMRLTVPEANPGLFVSMSLALTFPFNIVVGIPLYYSALKALSL